MVIMNMSMVKDRSGVKLSRLVIGVVLDNFFLYARVLPKKNAKLMIKHKSINRNCRSVRFESIEYNIMTDKNSVREYATMNLKIPNDVTKAARPSRITFGTQVMSAILEVKGLATLQQNNGYKSWTNLDYIWISIYQIYLSDQKYLIETTYAYSYLDSASESDIPTCAALNAPQSFAPSPHMAKSIPCNVAFNVIADIQF
jgi:hypothetical protein